ncbi:NADP-reducing hydrogenase subunit HndD [Candidatus Izimaplasma bacterium HR1]|jgi:NADP-reducing hydrogenase subunit HndD|uniref:[Fe-Fe] hydrogenase large subunit C-terminal domain-containing protein n=1 Tax=Candidatus Izimoplasma sp. HR1 TaxID=1541959 RepID=UPI0004F59E4F|nr:NADP-reducing hydrogenase subunit HndD [Candidatus Izimaplasma bacterium HR1]
MAKVTINGEIVKVKSGTTILKAAESIGIEIPRLCFLEEINEIGFCRICVVEVEGEQDLVSSCNTEIKNGMVIATDSEKVINSRRATLQLLASRHRFDCWRCPKDGQCEFYDLLKEFDVTFEEFGPGIGRNPEQIYGSGISQDQSKCVLCKRCVAVCTNVVTAKVLKFRDEDGINPIVSPTPGLAFDEAGCTFCGQCVKACPTGTLFETDHTKEVEALLRDKDTKVIAQINTLANSALAEEFGYDLDTDVDETFGKTISALELVGFNQVTTLDFGTDMQSYATAKEVITRLENSKNFPVITSTCPATNRYLELYKPELLDNLSTVKSPHTLQAALLKEKLVKDNVKVVTIDTCTSKKNEITRDELNNEVDYVLTVRELAKLLKRKNINYKKLENKEYKNELTGEKTPLVKHGALISTLNAVSELLDSKPLEGINFKVVRGEKFNEAVGMIKEAQVVIAGNKLNVAICHGGAAFKEMFAKIASKKQYHLVEMMTCPGGCINGGGMPFNSLPIEEVIKLRAKALHQNDELELSNPTHNKLVTETYSEELKDLIHTTYSQKEFTKE